MSPSTGTARYSRRRPHRGACSHFTAVATSTTEARLLSDGRWQYRTRYRCAACGALFNEQHTQHSPVS